ncbi:MAG TPA: o-succinylbenzoate synthase [Candidatus Dormibacteraeota bacterium]|jgi:O-succinylbenzoate synthase|nr:o-succinylbenzoate synthase [Candidatus Dormibacteraeota bacterium]
MATANSLAAPVAIEAVELIRVELPLVAPFRTSFGTETRRDVLLVHVIAGGAEGWGECVAMQEPLYSSEYVDAAQRVITEHLLPRLLRQPVTAEQVAEILAPVKGHRMAKAALEAAWLDAELRSAGRSLAAHLGAVHDRVSSGVSVGIMPSIAQLLDTVDQYVAQGYARIKLKIEPGWDVEPVGAVRRRFGDDMLLQVDANTAYTLDDAPQLARLDEFGLLLIEQPLPEEQILAHAVLARQVRTPICLDESIVSAVVAEEAIEMQACSIVNIKPGRVGGYLESVRIHDVCRERGVPVWCGGMLETGVGRAANLALAALPGFTLPGDTSASDRYYKQDLTAPFVLDPDGTIAVPQGPGIGVDVHRDVVDALATSTQVVRPGE